MYWCMHEDVHTLILRCTAKKLWSREMISSSTVLSSLSLFLSLSCFSFLLSLYHFVSQAAFFNSQVVVSKRICHYDKLITPVNEVISIKYVEIFSLEYKRISLDIKNLCIFFLGINHFDNKLCKKYSNYILFNYKNNNFFNWILKEY